MPRRSGLGLLPFLPASRPLCRPADPGPRHELLAKYLSHKTILSTLQLILGVCGVALVVYIPFVLPCGESMTMITVSLASHLIASPRRKVFFFADLDGRQKVTGVHPP